jgi:uncharacterized membrane protein
MSRFEKFLRSFVAGLAVLLPLLVTIGLVAWIFDFLNRLIGLRSFLADILRSVDFIPYVSEWVIVGIGYAIVIAIIALVGAAAGKVEQEKQVSRAISKFFDKIPLVNRVYKSVEQLWDLLFRKETGGLSKFGEVVVFDFGGTKTFGLLASRKKFVVDGKEHLLLFLPSSPIPATGFNYLVPIDKVFTCDISLEKFAKVHLSLGVLSSELFPEDFKTKSFANALLKKAKS